MLREVPSPQKLTAAESRLGELEAQAMGRGLSGSQLRAGNGTPTLYCYEQEQGFAYFLGAHDTEGLSREQAIALLEEKEEMTAPGSIISRRPIPKTIFTQTCEYSWKDGDNE